jgi:hypothetical protein
MDESPAKKLNKGKGKAAVAIKVVNKGKKVAGAAEDGGKDDNDASSSSLSPAPKTPKGSGNEMEE